MIAVSVVYQQHTLTIAYRELFNCMQDTDRNLQARKNNIYTNRISIHRLLFDTN